MQTQPMVDPRLPYQRDGFYVHREPVLSETRLESAVHGLYEVRDGRYETGTPPEPSNWKPGDSPDKLVKIEMPQLANRAVMEAVANPAIGELAARLTGASMVQVFWVQGLIKPSSTVTGGPATNVGWHQDRYYWGDWEDGSELLTAWLALSDVTEDAGPMKFVPGSQRWGLLEQNDFFAQELEAQKAAVKLKPGQVWTEVLGTLPPGGVSFHDNMTLHGSGPNRSGRPRISLALHLRTDRARPAGGKPQGLTQYIDRPEYCPVIYEK